VNSALDWYLLDNHWHQGVQKAVRDLNHLYLAIAALHELDFEGQGFEWIDCNDASHSTLSYIRRARDGSFVLVLLNFTPVPRHHHRINIPEAGEYEELFNSDSNQYGGSNLGNAGKIHSEQVAWMGPHLHLTLPPLAGLILRKIA
jgi:1,4-alpha-glucan branching enzyme